MGHFRPADQQQGDSWRKVWGIHFADVWWLSLEE